MTLPWDAATGAAIGADWLLAEIAPSSDFGRRARENERPYLPGDEAAAEAAISDVARAAAQARNGELEAIAAAIAAIPDPGEAFARAAPGGVLDDGELFDVQRFLIGLDELARPPFATLAAQFLAEARDGADSASTVAPLLQAFAATRLPGRGFYLAGELDPELAGARGAAAVAEAGYAAARGRVRAAAARFAGASDVRDGEFVVLRADANGAPPPSVRVVREAATYWLCELALDAAAVDALAARDAASERVAAAEEAARAALSARVGAAAGVLARAAESLGRLDGFVARARFARRYACVVPEIVRAAEMRLVRARHLPLEAELERRGEPYVALDLELAGIGVVTGANMGGKTAALRTVGFACACVALGLPVPAAAAAVPLVRELVWLGVGGAEPEERLLSAFGREVVALRAFFERDAARTLVLIDEFARTTAPHEGRALLIAVVARLRAAGALGLIATHHTGIAEASGALAFAVGGLREGAPDRDPRGDASSNDAPSAGTVGPLPLEDALALIARRMDRRLLPVSPGSHPRSDALALAELLGLDAALIARARAEAAEPEDLSP